MAPFFFKNERMIKCTYVFSDFEKIVSFIVKFEVKLCKIIQQKGHAKNHVTHINIDLNCNVVSQLDDLFTLLKQIEMICIHY